MALVDLTNVNPWKQENEAAARAYQVRNQGLQKLFDGISDGISAGFERRRINQEKDQLFIDRETAIANDQGNQLTQTQSTNKFTNKQLQEVGRGFKQEYYDAIQAYEQSDKGDEAKQALEDAKASALSSSSVMKNTLGNLDTQMELFREAGKNGNISSATDPAVRDFMNDLMDPATPVDKFQIVRDEEGNLKYQGETTNGFPVDFYLEDIANGQNGFTPVAKVDMPTVLSNLSKEIPQIKKEVERDWGVARVNDWDVIGEAMGGRLDQLLGEESQFRQIAAEMGYDYQAFEEAKAELGYDGLKNEVKNELMQQLAHTTPEVEERLVEYNPGNPVLEKAAETQAAIQNEQALQKQQDINATLSRAAAEPAKNLDFFRNSFIGVVPGVDEVTIDKKTGKLVFLKGLGKDAKPLQAFDLNNLADKQRLSEFMGGNRNLYNQADERNQEYQKQLESNIIDF